LNNVEITQAGGNGGVSLASVHSISWSSEKENNAIAPGSHHGTMVAKLWTPEDPRSLLRLSQQQQQQQQHQPAVQQQQQQQESAIIGGLFLAQPIHHHHHHHNQHNNN
jgi:hypothetical protein